MPSPRKTDLRVVYSRAPEERDAIARDDAKRDREEREEKAKLQREMDEAKREAEESDRQVARDYQRCFGRPVPGSWWNHADPSARLKILLAVYPGAFDDERAVCDR